MSKQNLTYIICGKLYNGIDAEFKENYKILVNNDKIEAIGPDIPQPESAKVIDLSDATVTPGMIDAHMHMDFLDWHTIREEVYTLGCEGAELAKRLGLKTQVLPVKTAVEGYPPPTFNLTSAIFHVCGAVTSTYESNEGLAEDNQFTAEEILLHHYCLFASMFSHDWRKDHSAK